jgi:Uma2 family endonuclease
MWDQRFVSLHDDPGAAVAVAPSGPRDCGRSNGFVGLAPQQCYIRAMTALPQHKMTVDEYLAWAEGRPGRFELYAGAVYAMTPERAGHAKIKFGVQAALLSGIRHAGLPCHMLPDGMTVRIDDSTAHEPDALVYCGLELPASVVEMPNPIIVAEVLSHSTRRIDASLKLAGYFRVPSVAHYLIVDPDQPLIIHHARGSNDAILTRIVREGGMKLDPPGLELALGDIYGAAQS